MGVVVAKGSRTGARFLGEGPNGEIDGRKLRTFDHPEVYRQWIDFWRRVLRTAESPDDAFDRLLTSGKTHFIVIPGGEITDTAADSPEQIAHYLYSLLVSEGGLAEALGMSEESATGAASFSTDIGAALAKSGVLADARSNAAVPHPVRQRIAIKGESFDEYRPSFVQENGRLYVMEPVDLTIRNKQGAKDRAGMTAYMFADIRKLRRETEPISLVRFDAEDRELEPVRLALSILGSESTIVDWCDPQQREKFLEQRVEVAAAA